LRAGKRFAGSGIADTNGKVLSTGNSEIKIFVVVSLISAIPTRIALIPLPPRYRQSTIL